MKSFNKNLIIGILVIIILVIGVLWYNQGQIENGNRFKIAFPFTQNVSDRTSLACEALIDSNITGSPVEYLTDGIEATVGKGTNKVSLQIKDEKILSFLSGASFEAGDVGGVDFSIIKNDDKELIAAMWNNSSMNTVVLNKENGLAIWSKSRSDFPTYGAPSGDLSYLICR